MKNSILLIMILTLASCGSRKVAKQSEQVKKDSTAVSVQKQVKKDSAVANITKISKGMSFDLEPVNGAHLAEFVYIIDNDTVKVQTTGKLRLNTKDTKEDTQIRNVSEQVSYKKDSTNVSSKVQKSDIKTERKNNSFQFILIGAALALAVQFIVRFLIKRYLP